MTKQAVYGIAILGKDEIKLDQDGIKANLMELDLRIHRNAVQCLIHAEIHGDTSLMRRLLIDIIPLDGNGYNRAGLINWMRKHSPMELTRDNINLSGTDEQGNKRPFQVELANQTPFYMDKANRAQVARPVFRDTLTSKLTNAIREFENAVANTSADGKALDPSKPFYNGVQMDKAVAFFDSLKSNVIEFTSSYVDRTRDEAGAKEALRKALNGLSAEEAAKVLEETKVVVSGPTIEKAA